MGTGSDHYGRESQHPYKSKNSSAFGSDYKTFSCSLTLKTQLLGSGRLMEITPLDRHIGFNSGNTSQISAEPHLEGTSGE